MFTVPYKVFEEIYKIDHEHSEKTFSKERLKIHQFIIVKWNCPGVIWYFEPHGKLLNPLPMVYPMVFWPPYPWYIDPPTHGILNPLPMVYQPPYPWYFAPLPIEYWPPTHDILTSLHIFWLEMGGSKYHVGSIYTPHGKLNPGSIYIHGILNPLIENWTPPVW
jgi:hypothetical protein